MRLQEEIGRTQLPHNVLRMATAPFLCIEATFNVFSYFCVGTTQEKGLISGGLGDLERYRFLKRMLATLNKIPQSLKFSCFLRKKSQPYLAKLLLYLVFAFYQTCAFGEMKIKSSSGQL